MTRATSVLRRNPKDTVHQVGSLLWNIILRNCRYLVHDETQRFVNSKSRTYIDLIDPLTLNHKQYNECTSYLLIFYCFREQ